MDDDKGLIDAIKFLIAADLIIEADRLYAEAKRIELWNAPWARNRIRRANKFMDRAKALSGERCLPWGIVWPEQ